MRAEVFAVEHNKKYQCYCEAVVYPDGDIEYAIPSHQYKLICQYGLDYETDIMYHSDKYDGVMKMIPQEADVVSWILEDKTMASLWYNTVYVSINYTKQQLEAIKTLIKEGCICKNPDVRVCIEKSVVKNLRDSNIDEVIRLNKKAEEEKIILINLLRRI